MSKFRLFATIALLVNLKAMASSTAREAIVCNVRAKHFVGTNMLIEFADGRAAL